MAADSHDAISKRSPDKQPKPTHRSLTKLLKPLRRGRTLSNASNFSSVSSPADDESSGDETGKHPRHMLASRSSLRRTLSWLNKRSRSASPIPDPKSAKSELDFEGKREKPNSTIERIRVRSFSKSFRGVPRFGKGDEPVSQDEMSDSPISTTATFPLPPQIRIKSGRRSFSFSSSKDSLLSLRRRLSSETAATSILPDPYVGEDKLTSLGVAARQVASHPTAEESWRPSIKDVPESALEDAYKPYQGTLLAALDLAGFHKRYDESLTSTDEENAAVHAPTVRETPTLSPGLVLRIHRLASKPRIASTTNQPSAGADAASSPPNVAYEAFRRTVSFGPDVPRHSSAPPQPIMLLRSRSTSTASILRPTRPAPDPPITSHPQVSFEALGGTYGRYAKRRPHLRATSLRKRIEQLARSWERPPQSPARQWVAELEQMAASEKAVREARESRAERARWSQSGQGIMLPGQARKRRATMDERERRRAVLEALGVYISDQVGGGVPSVRFHRPDGRKTGPEVLSNGKQDVEGRPSTLAAVHIFDLDLESARRQRCSSAPPAINLPQSPEEVAEAFGRVLEESVVVGLGLETVMDAEGTVPSLQGGNVLIPGPGNEITIHPMPSSAEVQSEEAEAFSESFSRADKGKGRAISIAETESIAPSNRSTPADHPGFAAAEEITLARLPYSFSSIMGVPAPESLRPPPPPRKRRRANRTDSDSSASPTWSPPWSLTSTPDIAEPVVSHAEAADIQKEPVLFPSMSAKDGQLYTATTREHDLQFKLPRYGGSGGSGRSSYAPAEPESEPSAMFVLTGMVLIWSAALVQFVLYTTSPSVSLPALSPRLFASSSASHDGTDAIWAALFLEGVRHLARLTVEVEGLRRFGLAMLVTTPSARLTAFAPRTVSDTRGPLPPASSALTSGHSFFLRTLDLSSPSTADSALCCTHRTAQLAFDACSRNRLQLSVFVMLLGACAALWPHVAARWRAQPMAIR